MRKQRTVSEHRAVSADTIVIRFHPFVVSLDSDSGDCKAFFAARVLRAMRTEWFILPEILVAEEGRKFVGVSFVLADRHQRSVQVWAARIDDERCRYVAADSDSGGRYAQFSPFDRLELYWETPTGSILCEGTLFDLGTWIYPKSLLKRIRSSAPLGYELRCVDEFRQAYGLE
jgi:hypothetical protein